MEAVWPWGRGASHNCDNNDENDDNVHDSIRPPRLTTSRGLKTESLKYLLVWFFHGTTSNSAFITQTPWLVSTNSLSSICSIFLISGNNGLTYDLSALVQMSLKVVQKKRFFLLSIEPEHFL